MAGTTGLEPATSAVTGQRSNQLSYVPRNILVLGNMRLGRFEGLQQGIRSLRRSTFPAASNPGGFYAYCFCNINECIRKLGV